MQFKIHNIVLYCIVLYCIVLYCIVLYCIILIIFIYLCYLFFLIYSPFVTLLLANILFLPIIFNFMWFHVWFSIDDKFVNYFNNMSFNLWICQLFRQMYCIVLQCIVLYCIVLHYVVLYCIVLYCLIPPSNKIKSKGFFHLAVLLI